MRRIADTVRFVETGGKLPEGGLKKRHRLIPHEEGILLDDLGGTDDPNVPTTARFQIKSTHHVGNGWSDDVSPSIVTVLNRSEASFESGTPGFATELQTDKWYFHSLGGGGGSHWGLVVESLGCGMYTIEIGTLDGETEASGSGDVCDPCVGVSGAGTSACQLEIQYPTTRVAGSGIYVTAYDPTSSLIPLKLGTDCVVTRMQGSSAPASGSGSGSGASGAGWSVRGFQEHIVQYKERWDCCAPNGPPVLIGKTPIIFVGIECAEIICGECPASGSGS